MIERGLILTSGFIALTLLAWWCIPRHLTLISASASSLPASFHARLEQGTLMLRGSLPHDASHDRILRQAQALYGNRTVRIEDQLTVDEQVAAAPWIEAVPQVLSALGMMSDRGSMIVDGRSVVVSTRVETERAKSSLMESIAPLRAAGLELEDHVLVASAMMATSTSLQVKLDAIMSQARIEFDSNKATLTPVGRATLDRLVVVLKPAPRAVIEISGHTDSYGAPAYNMDLSRRRAEAVRRYLLQHGLTHQFIAVGYGATRPLPAKTSNAAARHNRRIEFHVRKDGVL